jgi:hypothetical protein
VQGRGTTAWGSQPQSMEAFGLGSRRGSRHARHPTLGEWRCTSSPTHPTAWLPRPVHAPMPAGGHFLCLPCSQPPPLCLTQTTAHWHSLCRPSQMRQSPASTCCATARGSRQETRRRRRLLPPAIMRRHRVGSHRAPIPTWIGRAQAPLLGVRGIHGKVGLLQALPRK